MLHLHLNRILELHSLFLFPYHGIGETQNIGLFFCLILIYEDVLQHVYKYSLNKHLKSLLSGDDKCIFVLPYSVDWVVDKFGCVLNPSFVSLLISNLSLA